VLKFFCGFNLPMRNLNPFSSIADFDSVEVLICQ